ncbi:MAG: ribosome maturation factor [bacterium]|nr:ribosome maturation factor [bacterium]
MAHTAIDGELRTEFAAVARQVGCELVHAEFRGGTLRVFLDRPEGVTLDDCATVSKELSAVLDVADFGKGRYTLEVSSPGLDRRLYGPGDYERFCGRLVRVTYLEQHSGTTDSDAAGSRTRRTIVGRLEEFRGAGSEVAGAGEIWVAESTNGRRHRIPLDAVNVTRLEIEP